MDSMLPVLLAGVILTGGLAACGGNRGGRGKGLLSTDDAVMALQRAFDSGEREGVERAVSEISKGSRHDTAWRTRVIAKLQSRLVDESMEVAEGMGLSDRPSALALWAIRGRDGVVALARGLGFEYLDLAYLVLLPSSDTDGWGDTEAERPLNWEEIEALLEVVRSPDEEDGARIAAAWMLPWGGDVALQRAGANDCLRALVSSETASDILRSAAAQAVRVLEDRGG